MTDEMVRDLKFYFEANHKIAERIREFQKEHQNDEINLPNKLNETVFRLQCLQELYANHEKMCQVILASNEEIKKTIEHYTKQATILKKMGDLENKLEDIKKDQARLENNFEEFKGEQDQDDKE